jgi:hypothetical protein
MSGGTEGAMALCYLVGWKEVPKVAGASFLQPAFGAEPCVGPRLYACLSDPLHPEAHSNRRERDSVSFERLTL